MDTQLKQSSTGGEKPILIVEDSLTQAEQLAYILERHGFEVAVAANGREALAKTAEAKPALIISDIIMPVMDGFELCCRIKEDERFWDIPVILLTSLSDPRDVIKGLASGADNFITKPYEEEDLLEHVNRMLLEHHRPERKTALPGLEISFAGQTFTITSDRRQILDFLLSTYETAIRKNREVSRARDELNELNDQLESANKELESFSYTVSHDLRSPLTNIHGVSQLLLGPLSGRLDAECGGFIQTIFDEAKRMDQLIGTLLDFSRLTRSEITRTMVDLSELAQGIAAGLRVRQPERRVTFRIAEGIMVHADARLLKVVLENLIGNAWKYTGRTETAVIEFGMTEEHGEPVYYVRDNGAGFAMDQAGNLFKAFQRLHDPAEFEGFGIGLATVLRIIQRHGGRVWAEGEPDRGATFYFTLS
jgi:signal transduction histidine kinase